MATQTFNFTAPSGLTLTVDVLVDSTGSSFSTGVTTTEASSLYTFTLTDSAGTYRVNVKQAGVVVGVLYTKSTNIVATYNCVSELWMVDPPATVQQVEDAVSDLALETTAQDIKTLVQDVPTTTEFNARTLLAADYFNATADTVTVGTNNDKAGYSLSVTPPTASQIRSEIDTNSTKLIDIKTLVEDVPTNAEFASGLAGLNNLSTSDVTGLLTTLKSDLATTHGSGSWTTADVSALATQVSVNDLPTNAELATALAAADEAVLTAVATRASQASVDTIDDLLDTEVAAIKSVTDQYATMVALDGSVYRFTANALELGPSGSGGSATVVVYPLNASMPVKTKGPNLTFYKDEVGDAVGPISVTTRDGSTINPVDLAGKTLEVRFVDYLGTSILVVEDADITVSGTDHNQVSFPVTTDLTETVTVDHEDQWHYWSLRDVTADDDVVLVAGRARVLMA